MIAAVSGDARVASPVERGGRDSILLCWPEATRTTIVHRTPCFSQSTMIASEPISCVADLPTGERQQMNRIAQDSAQTLLGTRRAARNSQRCSAPDPVSGAAAAAPYTGLARSAHSPRDESHQVDQLFAPFRQGIQPGAAVLVVQDGRIVHRGGLRLCGSREESAADRRLDVSPRFRLEAVHVDGRDAARRGRQACIRRPGQPLCARRLRRTRRDDPASADPHRRVCRSTTTSSTRRTAGPATPTRPGCSDSWQSPSLRPAPRYEYSNPGYDMLAQVVEGASGKRFADFVRERIFVPLRHESFAGPRSHAARGSTARARLRPHEPAASSSTTSTRSTASWARAACLRRSATCTSGTRRCTATSS